MPDRQQYDATEAALPAARNCELCEAARFTEWYYEDDECWSAECEACSVPMIVWKRHDASPPDEVRQRLRTHLERIATERSIQSYSIDEVMRTIPDHYHAHLRPTPFGIDRFHPR